VDQHKRTLIKTVTWRIIALFITIIAVYIYSGDIKGSLTVGIAANALKMALYYAHERIWNRISFGKVEKVDYQI